MSARRFALRRSRQSRYLEPRSVKRRTVMPGRIVCFVVAALTAAALFGPTPPAAAQGSLSVYCSVQLEWCQALANEFTRQSGIKVSITQKGSGEVFAQLKAEAANPKADVWF